MNIRKQPPREGEVVIDGRVVPCWQLSLMDHDFVESEATPEKSEDPAHSLAFSSQP